MVDIANGGSRSSLRSHSARQGYRCQSTIASVQAKRPIQYIARDEPTESDASTGIGVVATGEAVETKCME